MYTMLILLSIIVIPIPVMMKYMLAGRNAYQGVLEGSLSGLTGVTLVFLMFWLINGVTFFEVLNSALNQIGVEDMNFTGGYAMLGLKDLEPDALKLALDNMKEMTKLAVPGIIIVISMVIAYMNYTVISWFVSKSGRKISMLPPFRLFSLPKSIVLGTLLIYILSYVTSNMGIIDKNMIMFNLELLFTFIFAIQGVAVVFYFGFIKKIPKLLLIIVSGFCLITWIGQAFLFLLGLADVVLGVRKRFSQTNLKQ